MRKRKTSYPKRLRNLSITNWHIVGGREMAISNEAWLTLTPWHADLATQPENHRSLTCTTNGMFTQLCNHGIKMLRFLIFNLIQDCQELRWSLLLLAAHACDNSLPLSGWRCSLASMYIVQTYVIFQHTEFGTNGPRASSSPWWSCPS